MFAWCIQFGHFTDLRSIKEVSLCFSSGDTFFLYVYTVLFWLTETVYTDSVLLTVTVLMVIIHVCEIGCILHILLSPTITWNHFISEQDQFFLQRRAKRIWWLKYFIYISYKTTFKRYSIVWHCVCQFLLNFDNSFINSNN